MYEFVLQFKKDMIKISGTISPLLYTKYYYFLYISLYKFSSTKKNFVMCNLSKPAMMVAL